MKNSILYFLFLITLFVSCTEENIDTLSDPAAGGNLNNVTYTTHVKGVLDNFCVSCHGAVNPSAGFDISSYTKAKNNITSIISRADKQTGQSGIMPPSGRMSEINIQYLKNWQTQGLIE